MCARRTDNVNGRYGMGGGPYEQANELLFGFSPSYSRLFRATQSLDCETDVCKLPYTNAYQWVHMAFAWSVNGSVKFFMNGNKVHDAVFCDPGTSCDGTMPIQPGGILVAGQEADGPWSGFDEFQAFDGLVDEVRTDRRCKACFS